MKIIDTKDKLVNELSLCEKVMGIGQTGDMDRKRSEQFINEFKNKPADCFGRLNRIIENSVSSQTLEESIKELKAVTFEIKQLGKMVF